MYETTVKRAYRHEFWTAMAGVWMVMGASWALVNIVRAVRGRERAA